MSATAKVNGHQNSPAELAAESAQKPWVVQKFGGTSIGKFAVNIAEDIVRYVPTWILVSGARGRLINTGRT